jgi:hypothetical protein
MDYPAPRVQITPEGTLDLSDAYAVGIGEWDKLAVRYAYSDFGEGADSPRLLAAIIDEAIDRNMLFLSDTDARSLGSAHPLANLWDNGSEPIAALENTLEVRRIALDSFGPDNLPPGQPMSELENVLVPVYLHHRYQVAATAKLVGGAYYSYKVRDDSLPPLTIVPADQQRKALEVVLGTLEPNRLTIDPSLVKSLHPAAFGYTDSGERFPTQTAPLFDPSAAAATAADLTLSALLHHHRAGRLAAFHALDAGYPGLDEVLESILRRTWKAPTPASDWEAATSRVVEWVTLDHLLELANQPNAGADVRSIAGAKLREFKLYLENLEDLTELEGAHRDHAVERIDRFLKRPYSSLEAAPRPSSPPGSPIGTTPR